MPFDLDRYLRSVQTRLREAGFDCQAGERPQASAADMEETLARLRRAGVPCRAEDVTDWHLEFLARKTEFQLAMLSQLEQMIVATRFGSLKANDLHGYVGRCWALAQAMRQGSAKPLALFCVAVADEPDDLAVEEAEWGQLKVKVDKEGMPVPLVFDATNGRLHYFQQIPFLAYSTYALFRKTIHRCLLPERRGSD